MEKNQQKNINILNCCNMLQRACCPDLGRMKMPKRKSGLHSSLFKGEALRKNKSEK